MLRRLIFKFSQIHPETNPQLVDLKNIQLRQEITLTTAKQFIELSHVYTPYAQTIASINKLMIDNSEFKNQKHLKALQAWKYNLSDTLPFCQAMIEENDLNESQINLLTMIAGTYPNHHKLGAKLHNVLSNKVDKDNISMVDLKRASILLSSIKSQENKQLFIKIYDKISKTQDPIQIGQYFSIYQKTKSEFQKQEIQDRKQLFQNFAKATAKQLHALTQKERGQIIGNVISLLSKQQQAWIKIFNKQVKVNTQTQFFNLLDFIQQYTYIYMNQKGRLDIKIIDKLLLNIEWLRTKFISNPSVLEAIETNRYFIQSVLSEHNIKRQYKGKNNNTSN